MEGPLRERKLVGDDSTLTLNTRVICHRVSMEGPLREQKLVGDDSTLTLNDLIQGLYVIK